MAETRDAFHDLSDPEGYMTLTWEGWPTFTATPGSEPTKPLRVKLGTLDVPAAFQLWVSSTKAPDDGGWAIALMFSVDEETQEVHFTAALSGSMDLSDALERVKAVRPMTWWKRKALLSLTIDSQERQLAEISGTHWDQMTPEQQSADDAGMQAIWNRVQAVRAIPLTRRRDRVTSALLKEVANVYRTAWKGGTNPTTAVAEHFYKSHSTAARWVGLARKSGDLGPSDGSRGGEIRS